MRQKGIFFCLFVTEETVVYIIERKRTMVHYCTHLCQQRTFQYGPVIKLPLHISQCHMVNHMAHMALTDPQWLQF